MAKESITVVNSFNAHAGLLGFLADPFRRAKHFNTVLGTGKEWANLFLCNWLLPGNIIAVSKDVQTRLLEAGVPSNKIAVVYNSTLSERFFTLVANRSERQGPINLCGIAMFTGNKGQEFIIPLLAALVKERGLDLSLTLVGDGPTLQNCKQMASDLGVADRVNFPGGLFDVVPELDASDIFIHLPRTETFGIVLAEAMARSLPVVTVRVGGIPEVVRERETGIMVDNRENKKALMDAVEQLAADPDMRQQMGERGREVAFGTFSLAALQRDLVNLYDRKSTGQVSSPDQFIP